MGAFNRVAVDLCCPWCSAQVQVYVQFKFGDCWQFDYRLGDTLAWGGNDQGRPGLARVVVDGEGETCPACGADPPDWPFYVFVEHDRLVAAAPADGRFDFLHTDDPWLVL